MVLLTRFASRRWDFIAAIACALAFTAIVALPGIPALRHDWAWTADRDGYIASALATIGGWRADGIGSARAYPSDYLIALVNIALAWIGGTRFTFVLNVAGIGFACAYGGSRLARAFSQAPAASAAAALFATFNPWVYTKLVAGHLSMLMAYGATMLLVAELLGRRRPFVLSLLLIVTIAQLQFFTIAFLIAAYELVPRGPRLPLWSAVIVALPIVAGVAFEQQMLAHTPFNLTWQKSQSIEPFPAFVLGGYFTKYADRLGLYANVSVAAVAVLALLGFALSRVRRPAYVAIAAAVFVWLVATGERGPLAPIYASLVLAVPSSLLFRELYDLLGYLAIAYVVLCALATARFHALATAWFVCGFALLAGWVVESPWTYFADALTIPSPNVPAAPNSRFALLPAFQPMTLRGRGLGLDPDAYVRPGNITPLNTALESFPMNVALADFLRSGRSDELAKLSVSTVVDRPWFSPDPGLLHGQTAIDVPPGAKLGAHRPSAKFAFVPELSTVVLESPVAAPPALGSGSVFFGDAALVAASGDVPSSWRALQPIVDVEPDRGHLYARDGWVDVRQALIAEPAIAQGLGGVVTTNSAAELPIRAGLDVLAYVRGRLTDERARTIVAGTNGYRWVHPPAITRALRCFGLCAIAAQGVPPQSDAAPATAPGVPMAFKSWTPWLVSASVPPSNRERLLRYNVAYDARWTALAGLHQFSHVRIDTIVNGWLLPSDPRTRPILLVETTAVLQAFFEITGVLYVTWIVVMCLKNRRAT